MPSPTCRRGAGRHCARPVVRDRYDIDDLKQVVDANLRERAREAHRAEALVEREEAKVLARLGDVEVILTIVSLREAFRRRSAIAAPGYVSSCAGLCGAP